MPAYSLKNLHKFLLKSTPSFSYIVAKGDEIVIKHCEGYSLLEPYRIRVSEATLYDLASLTKPLATSLITLKAFSKGLFDIFKPIEEDISLMPIDLLRHEANMPPWYPLYKFENRDKVKNFLLSQLKKGMKKKKKAVYSCLSYILLGFIIEEHLNGNLSELFDKLIREEIGIKYEEALFNPPMEWREIIAGTELNGDYERMKAKEFKAEIPPVSEGGLWGIVNDGNARFLGGIAGNAGLFGTVDGVYKIMRCYLYSSGFLKEGVLKLSYERGDAVEGEHRSVSFKLASSPDWELGKVMKKGAMGHEGFTGTFVYIDRDGLIMVLLTNRIHPKHNGESFLRERVEFVKTIYEVI